MNGLTPNTARTTVGPDDGSAGETVSSPARTPEDWPPSRQITSSAWEGWWWEVPLEETATDPQARQ